MIPDGVVFGVLAEQVGRLLQNFWSIFALIDLDAHKSKNECQIPDLSPRHPHT